MVDADKQRFIEVIRWLCRKYPVDGKPRPLPAREDLTEYFDALRDIRIDDLEAAQRWHYAHSEFYPSLPAALRRSVEEWRASQPPEQQRPTATAPAWTKEEQPPHNPVFSAKMTELFESLTTGRISVEEHMEQLRVICSDTGVPCDV